ncbi:MAG: caspase family protein [Cyanobacteria bacterium P01_A01_bin.17]
MPNFNHSYALVIGIDAYHHGITPLNNAVNDAKAIADLLKSKHGYRVWRLLDEEATGGAIQHYLKMELPRRVTANDRFLFYFSGHGIQLNSQEGPEGYLVPQTARVGQSETYLSMHEVYQDLSALPCRHLLGILDCCFAGSFRWSSSHRKAFVVESDTLYREKFDRFIRDPAWQIITSAAYDQLAYDAFDLKNDRGQDSTRPQHSPFAATLLAALEGGADLSPPAKEPGQKPGDGVITATELYQYVRDVIEPETDQRGMRQTPGLYPLGKHDKGEYIFLTPDHELNLPSAPSLDSSTNPYQGLASFNETDQARYFGRTAITKELYEFFLAHQLTVVLGPSGSGKSSLVKAGLLPQLRKVQTDKEPWTILPPFRPGDSPFQSLNQVLAQVNLPAVNPDATSSKSDKQQTLSPEAGLKNWFEQNSDPLVVVIDQFEELITRCGDKERQQFLESLSIALQTYPQKLRLVITLRSDFESQFQESPLQDFWKDSKFQVSALSRKELQQVIEEPAALRVVFFDPSELVDQLIDDVINMPGGLPLLSFALSELYLSYLQRQDAANKQGTTIERSITQEDYRALGGVTHALIQRADEECQRLAQEDPAYKQTIKQVMLRMVALGAGELARRPFLESEQQFPEPEQGKVKTVIDRFQKARLLVVGKTIDDKSFVEPAHDALVQGWPRLSKWLKQENIQETVLLIRSLTPVANQWANSTQGKKSVGLLWKDNPRLPQAIQVRCGASYRETWRNFVKWLWQDAFPKGICLTSCTCQHRMESLYSSLLLIVLFLLLLLLLVPFPLLFLHLSFFLLGAHRLLHRPAISL